MMTIDDLIRGCENILKQRGVGPNASDFDQGFRHGIESELQDLKILCDEHDQLQAELAALREAVRGLREHDHHDHCDFLWVPGEEEEECSCGAFDANAALAAARKLAGLE